MVTKSSLNQDMGITRGYLTGNLDSGVVRYIGKSLTITITI